MILLVALTVLLLLCTGATAATPDPNEAAATFWTSGWTAINQDQTLTFNHNLGVPPEQLAVELWFLDTNAGGNGIHRLHYGGNEVLGNYHGAYWRNLTANQIKVYRLVDDQVVDQINVRIWVVDAPDYDSGWQTIAADSARTFTHNLGDANGLNVAMWFRHPVFGIHQIAYGGLTDGTSEQGAYWHSLTNQSVRVYRRPNDIFVSEVRVVIVAPTDPPAYDSGWQAVAPGTPHTFNHNLGLSPSLLMVRGECRTDQAIAPYIHQMWAGGDEYAGGNTRGGFLRNLTDNSVEFFRNPNDDNCDEVRAIIYTRTAPPRLSLPLILRN